MALHGKHDRPQTTDISNVMNEWPDSWAGIDEDKLVGYEMVEVLRPFIRYLQQQNYSSRTIRRHCTNLWLIGGEIIRHLHFTPSLRKKSGRNLIIDAVQDGEAPLVLHLTESEQAALDASARKLQRFLSKGNPKGT